MSLHEDICSVIAVVIIDLERPVLQALRNEKRMFLLMVMLNILGFFMHSDIAALTFNHHPHSCH